AEISQTVVRQCFDCGDLARAAGGGRGPDRWGGRSRLGDRRREEAHQRDAGGPEGAAGRADEVEGFAARRARGEGRVEGHDEPPQEGQGRLRVREAQGDAEGEGVAGVQGAEQGARRPGHQAGRVDEEGPQRRPRGDLPRRHGARQEGHGAQEHGEGSDRAGRERAGSQGRARRGGEGEEEARRRGRGHDAVRPGRRGTGHEDRDRRDPADDGEGATRPAEEERGRQPTTCGRHRWRRQRDAEGRHGRQRWEGRRQGLPV
ncbi:MAG: hypothetical protein AVDCRST_MAG64-1481, partial [uncultured Phycisphaerae bacterium]